MPDGTKMPFKLEPWPGGRWFRNLGENTGHFWGNVQAIKRPTLLEFCGPLFMSQPVSNNVQYRLSEEGGETVIKFLHTAFGPILASHREGVSKGWGYMNDQAKKRAEQADRGKPRPTPRAEFHRNSTSGSSNQFPPSPTQIHVRSIPRKLKNPRKLKTGGQYANCKRISR